MGNQREVEAAGPGQGDAPVGQGASHPGLVAGRAEGQDGPPERVSGLRAVSLLGERAPQALQHLALPQLGGIASAPRDGLLQRRLAGRAAWRRTGVQAVADNGEAALRRVVGSGAFAGTVTGMPGATKLHRSSPPMAMR